MSFLIFFFVAVSTVLPQKVAVLAPDASIRSVEISTVIENVIREKFTVRDASLASAAFNVSAPENVFNLTTEQARNIGEAIGVDVFVLVRAATLRRNSSSRGEYYESSAAIWTVSSRTGRLVDWKLLRFEASRPDAAKKMLDESIAGFSRGLANGIRTTMMNENAELPPPEIEEPPEAGSPAAKNFRAPIPYRRVKPIYTHDAYLYDITATVDVAIDINGAGSILRTQIVRWAGYGLDESVESAVRSMNWRPAERNGKPLPMRFLVRYNFKKVEH